MADSAVIAARRSESLRPCDSGVLPRFEVDDLDSIVRRATDPGVEVVRSSRLSENGNQQFRLRDRVGCVLVLTGPSP